MADSLSLPTRLALSDGNGRVRQVPPVLAASLTTRERRKSPSLKDLVAAGVVPVGTTLTGFYKGAAYHVTVEENGHLRFGGTAVVSSLTAAVKLATGWRHPPSGWTWWHVDNGERMVTLRELREQAGL